MPDKNLDDKTEQPTSQKRDKTRKEGEVGKSKELPAVAVLLAGLITLSIFVSYVYTNIQAIMKGSFSLITLHNLSVPLFLEFAQKMITLFILTIIPLLAAVFITAIFSNIIQVGFMISGKSIMPKFSKLDPIKGMGKFFSKQSLMELFKTLSKLAIVGGVGYLSIKSEIKFIPLLGEMEIHEIVAYILTTIFKISMQCTLAMIVIVVIDYIFQKWEFEKKIMMTKKEVKDELKKSEGDPLIKSRIRSIQMQMAKQRMMQEVPQADVVITNPTHLAVAIKYDPSAMEAPKLLAKGARKMAEKIKELAEKHDIPIVENKELAQSLYALVEIGQEIPSALYQAVAEILAYIYKLQDNYAEGRF